MPLQKLQFRPGLNREGTDYANEGGWYDGDKIRFRSGFPEKIGGWVRFANSTFVGICRSLWNWVDVNSNNYIGIGTSKKYYIEKGSSFNDVTPLLLNSSNNTTTTLAANPFSAVSGSDQVTVTDGVSGITPSINDYVILTSTTTVGGLTISGEYVVSAVLTPTTFKITATANASSTGTGGGTVTIQYEYPVGNDVYTTSNGWGAGPWSPTVPTTLGTNPFSVVQGSSTVTVTETANGYLTSAGSFTVGKQYKIVSVGSTSFTSIGASANTVGTIFTATGAGTGSGTASIVWVAFSGVTNITPAPSVYGFFGTIGFRTGTYGMLGYSTDPAVEATLINGRAFEITYVNANTYTITLPNANASSFRTGVTYIITFVGTTDFTAIGASSNTVGVSFTATGPGSGTGTASVTAISSTNGGGTNVIAYPEYGIRPWGSAADVGIGQQLRLWSNDNYGQDLVIAPRGGAIYYWSAISGVGTRAQLLAKLSTDLGYDGQFVPNATFQIIASSIQRFVIAFGANSYLSTDSETIFDPMLVRWSDQENPYEWVPQVTNQSGEFRLSNGSYIVSARTTRQEILVWTDSAIYSMQYLGAPYVWGFQILMDNISIISPNAMVTVNNVTYWMGVEKFYMYSGRVETLPCSLRQYIFADINQDQGFEIFSGANEGYNEVWWFYVGSNSEGNQVNKYVIYNYLDRVWYYGNMARTAWLQTGTQQYPVAANYLNNATFTGSISGTTLTVTSLSSGVINLDTTLTGTGITSGTQIIGYGTGTGNTGTYNISIAQTVSSRTLSAVGGYGYLLYHENGVDDVSGLTARAIESYVQSSDFDIGDGHNFGFVWRILPDVNFNGSNVNNPQVTMTVRPRQNSGTPYGTADNPAVVSGNNYANASVYNVQEFTGQVYTRLRGRQMAFRIESADIGTAWQLGSPRIDIRPDGRR